ncbi:IclR family transcriptional regulator [Terrabacter sp. NPDC080008]|uniref:IclR family transcriptional regulator n=1 Tax=Terrabacter sp. NPDC080008 TaxID=3155176 RepID=UPI00344FD5BF
MVASRREARTETPENKGSSVIVTVIQVLRCFTVDQPLQGVTEIAARVGLHKSSVSRILATLEKEQVVERDPQSRKYRLGLGLLSIAGSLLADLDVRRAALPVLRDLAEQTSETTALVVWSGRDAVTVEQVPSAQQIKHTNPLGTRYDTFESASVQVFLADLPHDEVVARVVAASGSVPLLAMPVDAYVAELSRALERGYAVNYRLTSDDEVGVASPVRDHRGETVAAVLVAAPAYRVTEPGAAQLGERARAAADEISRRLGGAG